jgi:hypothetical protein
MNKVKRISPFAKHLDEIEARCTTGEITLRDIFNIFGDDGHYLLIFFLILPFLQPVPLFGLSTPFGILISIVAVFAFKNKPPFIPQRWADKKLPRQTVLKIAEGAEKLFHKLSFILHPRWPTFFKHPLKIVSTILIVLNAILLALPLPIPFSNAFPAWMILFQALGHLEDDGFLILLSYIQTILCLLYFGLIAMGVDTGVDFIKLNL